MAKKRVKKSAEVDDINNVDLAVKWIAVKDLKPNPKNENKHSDDDVKYLAKLLKYQKIRKPIIVSNQSGLMVTGHLTRLAIMHNELAKAPVSFQDFESEEQETAHRIADNAAASWAELDLSMVNADLADMDPGFDVDMFGIKDFEIEPADKYGDKDADHIPESRATNILRGDLFSLGVHKLLCGDSTSKDDVERLLNGEKADMVYTDPPYGMNLDTDYSSMIQKHGGKGQSFKKVEGDSIPFDPSHLLNLSDEVFIFGGDYFAHRLPDNGSWIVWDKRESEMNGSQMGEAMYGSAFELCWSKQKHKRMIARILWAGGVGEGISEDRKGRNNQLVRSHPTQKPIKLAEWFFECWGKDKTNIVDLYGGSGSTLIACEKTNRKCFMMEIDPQYCQVIIDRFEKFSGQKAVQLTT